ncbi:hypothetical protein PCAU_3810 [Pseudomonas chlororaphis subsp. aurantiaca]|nr:hypothetical protein PCAU_3810 [Pseudomonas chlororaphis subsp. aurantiaca]
MPAMGAYLTHRAAWIASKLGSYRSGGVIENAVQPAFLLWCTGSSTRKVVPTPTSLRTEMSPRCFLTMP